MTSRLGRSPQRSRRCRPTLEPLEDRTVPTASWSNFAHDPQHTGISPAPTKNIDLIRWQTPVDLNNTGALVHYGSPVISSRNTIVIPVKTGASGGFEMVARNGTTGQLLWTNQTDYTLPPFSWMPPVGPALTPSGRLYFAGNGGTVYYVNHPDSAGAPISGQLAFYGIGLYNANKAAFNSSVMIDTPITADNSGNIYFGFEVTGSNPANLTGGGVARIDSQGNGSYVLAGAAANDNTVTKVPLAAAPALSNDGSTLYVSVNEGGNYYGYLLALDSTTLATRHRVFLQDPRNGASAGLLDVSTATPMVAPDGTVFYGVFGNPYNGSRGFLLHFSADLATEYTPGAFGWDDSPSIVPATMVPSYHGTSSFLVFSKYNNYVSGEVGSSGGQGVNKIAVLDPYASETDPNNDGDPNLQVMKEVLTMAGPTPDTYWVNNGFPNAVREWCINDTVVDPATKSILVNSEDGNVYRWDLRSDTLTQAVNVTLGIGEPYTPTFVGPSGTVYAINGGTLFALGSQAGYTYTDVSSLNPAPHGHAVTFTAMVVPNFGNPRPTGTITFEDGTTVLATVNLGDGPVTYTNSSLSVGNHFITAVYSGDSHYQGTTTTLVESIVAASIATTAPVAFSSATGPGTLAGKAPSTPGQRLNPALLVQGGSSNFSASLSSKTGGNSATFGNDSAYPAKIPNLSAARQVGAEGTLSAEPNQHLSLNRHAASAAHPAPFVASPADLDEFFSSLDGGFSQ